MGNTRYAISATTILLLASALGIAGCGAPHDNPPDTAPSGSIGFDSNPDPQVQQNPTLPPARTSEPPPGGNTLADTLPAWNPTSGNPETEMSRIAEERNWAQYSEPNEDGSSTYLTETDTAINVIWVDNDTNNTVHELAAHPQIPFYHGGSSTDLTQTSTGYLDRGYHFPETAESWLAWKTKWALTPGRIRSFRYRIETGTAPAFQVGVQSGEQALLARYTPDPTLTFVTVPLTLDSSDTNWALYNHTGTKLGEQLTWAEILAWPTPAGWASDTFANQPIDPATQPAQDGINKEFLPGDRNIVSVVNTSNNPTHLSMIEFGFHWTEMGRDYLQIRLFPQT